MHADITPIHNSIEQQNANNMADKNDINVITNNVTIEQPETNIKEKRGDKSNI